MNVSHPKVVALLVLSTVLVLSGCGNAPSPQNRPNETAQLVDRVWRLESLDAELSTRLYESTSYTIQEMARFRAENINPADGLDLSEIGRRLSAYTYSEPSYEIVRTYDDYVNTASSTRETTSSVQYTDIVFLANGNLDGRVYDDSPVCMYRGLGTSRWGWKDSNISLIEFSGSLFEFDSAARIDNYTASFENGKLVLSAHTGDEPGLTGGYDEATVRAVFRPVADRRCRIGQPVVEEAPSVAAPTSIGAGTTSRAPGGNEPVYQEPSRPPIQADMIPEASFTIDWNKQTGVLRLDGSESTAGYSYQWFLGWMPAGSETLVASTDPRLVTMVYEHQLQAGGSASVRWVVLNLLDPSGRVVASQRQILQ